MIQTVTDNELAQAAEIQRLNNEATAWAVTVDNLTRERNALVADQKTYLTGYNEMYLRLKVAYDELQREVASLKLLDSQRLESLRAIEQESNAWEVATHRWIVQNGRGGWIDDLRNRVAALEIERDALRADAERYRHARDKHAEALLKIFPAQEPYLNALDVVDSAIDAAKEENHD